ncbi:SURF1 family cytochrome oxidase biogenesis protein [Microbacterium sp.]|uniref:SURF1 family cytochrome oxidase biogenesis protein n=1 Tax=Microbacterium sp. TaxID=51671 RepID=UPI0039E53081
MATPTVGAEPEVFPPTLREVMLRPWWIGMLAFALLVAALFAWLGQWQLARAIDTDPPQPGATEIVRPIGEVTAPGEYLPEPLVGQKVRVSGWFVPGDFLVVSSRFNDGVEGYWVTGQLRVDPRTSDDDGPTSLAVALGWAATREEADRAVAWLDERTRAVADVAASGQSAPTLTGRLISDEGPLLPPRDDVRTMTRMSPAALLGWWHDVDDLNVYRAYLVSDEALAGLATIDSPAPEEQSNVNWLNIFYAVEWAVFAGFAFYMWYRLARDAWEREVEALAEAAGVANMQEHS